MGSYSGAGGNESYNSSDRSGSYGGGGGGGGTYGGGGGYRGTGPTGAGGDYAGGGGSGGYRGTGPTGAGGDYAGGGGSGDYRGTGPTGAGGDYAGGSYGRSGGTKSTSGDAGTGGDTSAGTAGNVDQTGGQDTSTPSVDAGAGDPGTATDAPAAPDTGTQNDAASFTGDASGDVTGTPPGADQVAVDNMLSSPTGPDVPGTQAEAATGAAPTAAGPAGPGAVASGAGAGQDDLLSISGDDPLAQDQGAAFESTQTQTIAGQAPASAYGVGADPSADQGAQFDPTQTTNTYDPSPVAATDVGVNSGQPPADWALSQPQDTTDQLAFDPAAASRNLNFAPVGPAPGSWNNTPGVSGGPDPTAGQNAQTPAEFTGVTSGAGTPLQAARMGYFGGPGTTDPGISNKDMSTLANSIHAEVGGMQNPQANTAYVESVGNRAMARNQTLTQADSSTGYYPTTTTSQLANTPSASSMAAATTAWNNFMQGANVSKMATGNASDDPSQGQKGLVLSNAANRGDVTADFRRAPGDTTNEGFAIESSHPTDTNFASNYTGTNAANAGYAGSGAPSTQGNPSSTASDPSLAGGNEDLADPGTGLGTIGPSQFASAGSMLAPGVDASIADTSPTSAASAGSMLPGQTTDFLADPDGTTTDPMSANFQTEFGPPAPGPAPLDPTTAFPGNVSGPPAYYGATQFDPSQTSLAAPGALGPVNAPAPNTPGGAITWDDFLEQQRQLATNMPAGPDPLAYGAPQFDPNQTQTNPPGALGAPFSQPGPVGGMGINIGQAFNSAQTQAAADQALQDLLQQGPSPAPGGMPAVPAPGTPNATPASNSATSPPDSQAAALSDYNSTFAPQAYNLNTNYDQAQANADALLKQYQAAPSAPPAPAGSAFAPQPTGGMGINLPSMASVMDNPPPAPASNEPTGPQQIPMPPSAPGYYGGLNIDAPQTYGQPTYPVQPGPDLLAPNNQPINPLANAEQIFGPYTPTTPYPANPNVQFGPPNQEAVPAPSPKTVDISMEQGVYLKSHPDVAKSTFDNLNLPPGSTINLPGGYGTVTLPGYGQPITGPDGTVYGTMPAQPMRTAAMGAPGPAQPAGPNADYPQPGYTPGAPFTQQAAPETAAPPASDPLAPPGTSSPLAPGGASPPSTPATAAPSQPQAIAGAGGGGGGGVTGGVANTGATGGGGAQGQGGAGQQKITPQLVQQTMQAAAASSPQVAAAVNGLSQGNQQYVTAYQQSLTSQWSQVLLSQGTTDPTQSPAWPQVQAIIQQQVNQLIVQLGGRPATKAA